MDGVTIGAIVGPIICGIFIWFAIRAVMFDDD